jgi:hypothetical protein
MIIGSKISVPAMFGGFHEMTVTKSDTAENDDFTAVFMDGEVFVIMSKNIFKEF